MAVTTQTHTKPIPMPDKPYWQEYHEAWPLATADENDVRAIVLDKAGQPWVATKDGPRVLVRAAWVKPDGADAVGSSHSICIDANGTVWVGATSGLWMISGGKVQPVPSFTQVPIGAVSAKGNLVVAAGPDGVFWTKGGYWAKVPGRTMQNVRTVFIANDGHIWVGTSSGLYILDPSGKKPVVRLGRQDVLLSSNVHDIRALKNGDIAIASTGGLDIYRGRTRVKSLSSKERIPCRELRAVAQDADGRLWLPSRIGVVRFDGDRFRLRHSRRWLLADDARGVAIGPDGSAWVATAGGVDTIRRKKMTLEAKADYFLGVLRKRHIREPGLVGPAVLKKRGDLSESFIEDDDNDGEHTGMYIAIESLRYAVTKDPRAKANARAAFRAMEILQEATGTPHFIARSVLPVGTAPLHEVDRTFTADEIAEGRLRDPREKPIAKRWLPTKDGKYLWKRDASSDEVDGHMYGYALFHDLAADAADKKRVASLVDRIIGGIVDNGYVLQDIDGKATRWGNWSPKSLNGDPNWNEERYGNSTEIISHLGVAYHMTGKQKYVDAANYLIQKHGYAQNIGNLRYVTPSEATHINDELLSMVFPNLFNHLLIPDLKMVAIKALRQWHQGCVRDNIPFYDFVYNTYSGSRVPLDGAMTTLRDWPLDQIEWTVDNRFREDVTFDRVPGRDGVKLSKLVPRNEMGLCNWDQEPYFAVIGRNGEREDRPSDWLLAYWMGRYWGHITAGKR